ncbi:MAG: Undecaprenyl-diphosphatase [Mycoplasmataceae bacterium]|nr:MAG: Undecaprenyl-diphosphatase [Mycoplasmataceae bacterium]
MKIGYYLNYLKQWTKEGWKFFFEDTQKIEAHHLIAFLLTVIIIYLLSYIIAKIFSTLVKIIILITLIWLLWMFLFDRSKYNELFARKENDNPSEHNDND